MHFLDQNGVVAEGAPRLGPGRGQRLGEALGRVDPAHPLAAAAGDRLDENRPADLGRRRRQHRVGLVGAVIARHHTALRPACISALAASFRPIARIACADGPMKVSPAVWTASTKSGFSEEEAVARMDRLGAGRQRHGDDPVAAQIGLGRCVPQQPHRLIGHRHMPRAGVGVGMDGDGGEAQPAAGVDDPAGDLAPIGDQDAGEHAAKSGSAAASPWGQRRKLLISIKIPWGRQSWLRTGECGTDFIASPARCAARRTPDPGRIAGSPGPAR